MLARAFPNDNHIPPSPSHTLVCITENMEQQKANFSGAATEVWNYSKLSLSHNLLPGIPTRSSRISQLLCWDLVLIFSVTWVQVQQQEQMGLSFVCVSQGWAIMQSKSSLRYVWLPYHPLCFSSDLFLIWLRFEGSVGQFFLSLI